jgi:hypothetical protein
MFVLEYWRQDPLSYRPVKDVIPVPQDPINWPIVDGLIKVVGEIDDSFLEAIVEKALELGWGFNPLTMTFYRLD